MSDLDECVEILDLELQRLDIEVREDLHKKAADCSKTFSSEGWNSLKKSVAVGSRLPGIFEK